MSMTDPIVVLMPVKNGAAFLRPQIDSLVGQTTLPSVLLVSDDGSRDRSVEIIQDAARDAPFPVRFLSGPRTSYAANIAHLIRHAPVGYWAFCDQDDIWLPDRLARGVAQFRTTSGPALQVSKRIVVTADLDMLHALPLPNNCSFKRTLLHNPAPANATVLNPKAVELVRRSLPPANQLPSFPDWWIAALVLGAGGWILFDTEPGVWYRQHHSNLFGARMGPGWIRRIRWLTDGTHVRRMREVRRALRYAQHDLSPQNRAILCSHGSRRNHLTNQLEGAISRKI